MRYPLLALALSTSILAASTALAHEEGEATSPEAPKISTNIAEAPAGTYALEKGHASIVFKANHMGFADYVMRFDEFDATIELDPKAPEKSSVKATIIPASLDSNDTKLTAHTSSKDFFNVEKYPTMTFASTKIEKTGSNTGKIYGNLTMLGVTKQVVLDTTFNAGGPHMMMKKYDLGFNAKTTIKRSEFGMNYGIPMVSDAIPVEINAEFVQK